MVAHDTQQYRPVLTTERENCNGKVRTTLLHHQDGHEVYLQIFWNEIWWKMNAIGPSQVGLENNMVDSRECVKWVMWPQRIEDGPPHSNASEGISMVASEPKRASVCWSHCSAMASRFVQPGNPWSSQNSRGSQPPEHENSETSEKSSQLIL